MSEVVIREATMSDVAALRRCEQSVIAAERPYDSTLAPDVIHYYSIEQMIGVPRVRFLVAEAADHEIVGCGFARLEAAAKHLRHAEHAYLGLMFVAPQYRGRGVNRRLIDELKRWCRAQNVRELRLEVYDDNAAALRAYEKVGFSRHIVLMRLGLED